MNALNHAFKIVCVDENNPIEYAILDEINKDNMKEVCKYLLETYQKYNDINNCKWLIIPIPKLN